MDSKLVAVVVLPIIIVSVILGSLFLPVFRHLEHFPLHADVYFPRTADFPKSLELRLQFREQDLQDQHPSGRRQCPEPNCPGPGPWPTVTNQNEPTMYTFKLENEEMMAIHVYLISGFMFNFLNYYLINVYNRSVQSKQILFVTLKSILIFLQGLFTVACNTFN